MGDPEKDRRMLEFLHSADNPPAVVPAQDLTIDGPHGPVPVRVYGDPTGSDRPALLWMHGGGFMMGDLDMPEADWTSREICARTGAVVVSVDYRLAVGGVHYPVPLDDCVAATRWLRDNGSELGVDPTRITVGGASAGGNLAMATTLRLRDEDGWQPAALVPVYPVLHDVLPAPTPERGGAARRGAARAPVHARGHRLHERQLPRRPPGRRLLVPDPRRPRRPGADAARHRGVRRPAHHRRGLRRPAERRRSRRQPRPGRRHAARLPQPLVEPSDRSTTSSR